MEAMKPLAGIPVLDRLTADEANLRVAARLDEPSSTRLPDADVTVNRLRPHFSCLAIVRMAGVTPLDRIGIPVCVCGRSSHSRTLAVRQGKGISAYHARASALVLRISISLPILSGICRKGGVRFVARHLNGVFLNLCGAWLVRSPEIHSRCA